MVTRRDAVFDAPAAPGALPTDPPMSLALRVDRGTWSPYQGQGDE